MDIPEGYQRLEGSERRPAPNARRLGPADAAERLSVTIVLRRRPDGMPLADINSVAAMPPSGRMSNDEFAVRYGASPDDIDKVAKFAAAHGLTVAETHAARRTVIVSGTVAQMSNAFAVELNRYEVPRSPARRNERRRLPTPESYRGRDGFIHVPAELAGLIVGVFGLDNRSITKRNAVGDPPNTTTLTVPTITKLYNFPSNRAAGQTIAIFSEDGYDKADIQQYYSNLPAGYVMPTLIDVSVDASNSGNPDPETTQDICIASTVAQGAEIAVYFTTYDQKGWVDLIQRVAHPNPGDPVCSVLSSSFYVSNGDDAATLQAEGISTAWLTAVTAAFQDAALQGVTVCIASGDTGSQSKVGDGKAHVQYPASDPWVLSVGGTTVGNVQGSSFEEYVWNDVSIFGPNATGGGVSDFFALPAYQSSAGVPQSVNGSRIGRGVPDIAANASVNSGYPMIAGGAGFTGNGTSASAPLCAGLVAVLNAALGKPVGFLNPMLYMLGNSVCQNISSPPGPADNGLFGVAGYPAGPGWNACTGWGRIDGNALLLALMIDIESLASIAAQ
jgi:kumamolisin